jgi:hypothetical protein
MAGQLEGEQTISFERKEAKGKDTEHSTTWKGEYTESFEQAKRISARKPYQISRASCCTTSPAGVSWWSYRGTAI